MARRTVNVNDKDDVVMNAHAYYCAKCKHTETDPTAATWLSVLLGVELWRPFERAGSYDYPAGADVCRQAIDDAVCVICQPPIGNDCSWELGYAVGLGKPVYVIGSVDEDDWMTRLDVFWIDPVALAGRKYPRERLGGEQYREPVRAFAEPDIDHLFPTTAGGPLLPAPRDVHACRIASATSVSPTPTENPESFTPARQSRRAGGGQ